MTKTIPVVLAAALAAAGCSREKTVPVRVVVETVALSHSAKVEVLADGAPAEFVRQDDHDTRFMFGTTRVFQFRAVVKGDRKTLPALTVRVLYPCGWREQPLRIKDEPTAEFLRDQARGGRAAELAAFPETPFPLSRVEAWVDNRGGAAGVFQAGEVKVAVPAKTAFSFELDVCAAPVPASYDGVPVGELPAAVPEGGPRTVWVDPSGKRCYGHRTVTYGFVYGPGVGGGSVGLTRRLAGRKLYTLDHPLDFVFTRSPEKIEGQIDSHPTYGVIEDARCL